MDSHSGGVTARGGESISASAVNGRLRLALRIRARRKAGAEPAVSGCTPYPSRRNCSIKPATEENGQSISEMSLNIYGSKGGFK